MEIFKHKINNKLTPEKIQIITKNDSIIKITNLKSSEY